MEHRCYCCCAFHSHNPIFNNEQNSYPKMNVKQTLTYMYAEQQGIVSFENDLKRVQVYNTIASSDDACFLY